MSAINSEWVIARTNLYQLWQKHPDWSARRLAMALERSESWVKKWLQRFKSMPTPSFNGSCIHPASIRWMSK